MKDKGPVMGTDIKNLCALVGGMSEGDEVSLRSADGYRVEFAYKNVNEWLHRQGPIVLCWYHGEDDAQDYGVGYPGNDAYFSAMQIVFMPKTANQDGKYVFGNNDMRVCLPEEKYQHFYEGFPSTNGLSGKWISEILIYSNTPPSDPESGDGATSGSDNERDTSTTPGAGAGTTPDPSSDSDGIPWTTIVLATVGVLLIGSAVVYFLTRRKAKSRTA